tara:strand:- start:2216 stop:2473 length:258 start_codon:yes stop_codon:yes gene_type:complete
MQWDEVSTLGKLAGLFFIIGKIHFIPAAGAAFASSSYALPLIVIYATCVGLSIILALIDMKFMTMNRIPSEEKVREWMRHYESRG